MSRITNWSPAQLPPELKRLAKPCEVCAAVRQEAASLMRKLLNASSTVALTHQGQLLELHNLDVSCTRCRGTGVVLNSTLAAFIDRVGKVFRRDDPGRIRPPEPGEPGTDIDIIDDQQAS